MEGNSSNELLQVERGGQWWKHKMGQAEEAVCPRYREEEETPNHILFRCKRIKRVEDIRGRIERAREKGLGLAS